MKETALEKRAAAPLKEKVQYTLAFGVIALMLYIAGFPIFLLFFVGVLTFFIWKVFSADRRDDTRRIFEFYLLANEILRDDDRRWFGFEIQEAIARGDAILSSTQPAPPLVYFALGALHNKLGDHTSAIKYLSAIEQNPDEIKIIFPTKELREYARVLRKIERVPAEAPLTSAAIRALERARKNRAEHLLAHSRTLVAEESAESENDANADKQRRIMRSVTDAASDHADDAQTNKRAGDAVAVHIADDKKEKYTRSRETRSPRPDRKTISEVLHDIYDTNIS